jgi:MinD-like ATPase involved in chromosome partitioning or flagellar assembly
MTGSNGWNLPESSEKLDVEMPAVVIGAPHQTSTAWLQSLTVDKRFRVSITKNNPQELVVAVADSSPDAVLLHYAICENAQRLIETVARLQCDVYVVIPQNTPQEGQEGLRELSNLKGLYQDTLNWPEVTTKILADVAAKRRMAKAVDTELWRSNTGIAAGMYNIVFWNRSGGTGRTSIAAAFAQACAARGVRTLLVSLAAPCPLPYMLDLKANKNISEWFARPSMEEGFQNAVQPYRENLDVIVGLQDAIKERDFMQDPKTNATINDLSIMAARTGYGVVVLDAPTAIMTGAGAAISAANYMVLVARPVITDLIASVEAFRLVVKNLAGQHVIKPGNVICVLNRVQEGLVSADEFHRLATNFLAKQGVQTQFPIIAASIKEDITVQHAQNDGKSVLEASDGFARSIHSLVALILGAVDKNNFTNQQPKKKKLFGLF